MTLKEYLNQKDPVKMPDVFLEDSDYTIGITTYDYYTGTNVKKELTQIFIKCSDTIGLNGTEYLKVEGVSRLFTVDSDGNRKSLSCFRILNLKAKEKTS
jgi:hypothetical protein